MGPRKKSKGAEQAPGGSPAASVPPSKDDMSSEPTNSTAASSEQLQRSNPSVSESSQCSLRDSRAESIASKTDITRSKEPAVTPKRSWYGGSWRSKARPVTEVARESASGSPNTSPSQTRRPTAHQNTPKTPKQSTTASPGSPSKGAPVAASMTKVHATSGQAGDSPPREGTEEPPEPSSQAEPPFPPDPAQPSDPPPDPAQNGQIEASTEDTQKQQVSPQPTKGSALTSWYGWWSRPDGHNAEAGSQSLTPKAAEMSLKDSKKTSLPEQTPEEERNLESPTQAGPNGAVEEPKSDVIPTQSKPANASNPSSGKSWFGLWSGAENAKHSPPVETTRRADPIQTNDQAQTADSNGDQEMPDAPLAEVPQSQNNSEKTTQSSSWAFWSRQPPRSEGKQDPSTTHKQVGELAVADTPSQSHPEAAQFNEQEQPAKQPSKSPSSKSSRSKAQAKEPASKATDVSARPSTRENLLLPRFSNTYHAAQPSSYWQQIRQFFLGDSPAPPHVHLNPNPPRIRKALAIGVHGWFPAAIINGVIGQPTGTSIRFANHAAEAIERWVEAQGYNCEIEKVALEGEGMVSDRVDTLWKLLLNWIEHIKNADFILMACHSQGVPVGIMLVSKLVQFGCINPHARIGVCAMAGVNLGPFPEYRSRLFGGAAFELFEFTRRDSKVSKAYSDALDVLIKAGVKVVYVGSIDDQLVSLESSTFSNIAHPYIFRAVFVDGRIHAPDFIARLVGFVLKLRNLGIPDHGLIRELSPALAGSLYTGEGHSRIYDEPEVYYLAIQCTLETTDLPAITAGTLSSFSPARAVSKAKEEKSLVAGLSQATRAFIELYEANLTSATPTSGVTGGLTTQNPYFLPWAMRGLLEEDFVRKELRGEVHELLEMFEAWKPTTKQLRDVKFRLEAVRSKL